MNSPIQIRNNRIIVIDDNPSIHEDIRKILHSSQRDAALEDSKSALFGTPAPQTATVNFQVDSALQGEEGLRMIETAAREKKPYAVAFVDVRMPPGWDGVETIARIWEQFPDLQVIVCTAYSDYSWEEMIRKIGRSDSLLILKKPFDNIEVLQLATALTQKWCLNHVITCRLNDLDQLVAQRTLELQSANEQLKKEIAERIQAEHSLRLSEERFSKAFKASPIPLAIQSLISEVFVDANDGFLRLAGFTRAELIGRTGRDLQLWENPDYEGEMLQKLRQEMAVRNLQCRLRSKSGLTLEILLSVEVIELDGEPYLLVIAQDITEQTKLEDQLRQAQKMEAVGQLAAGVAHDFNNILTIVQGNACLALDITPPGSLTSRPLENICAAADRAGKLVRQLLTFSRKQVVELRPADLRQVLTSLGEMLPSALTPIIGLSTSAAPGLPLVCADVGMMETLLMNLAVNARDAMPEGGRLGITIEPVTIPPGTYSPNPESRAGQFVRLSVTDTGSGIPPEVLPRIFEPFFTTKPIGKGTGLGLATVYGIVKQHQGWMEVRSQLNVGTTFDIFLPALDALAPAQTPATSLPASPGTPGETILVVEDEPDLRDLVVQVLEVAGYRMLQAGSGVQALEQWSKREGHIHLLLTDIVMPDGVSGRKLAEKLRSEDPQLRVIYTSGYSAGMPGTELANVEPQSFLAKPYRPATLLKVVRECLDQPVSSGQTVAGAA